MASSVADGRWLKRGGGLRELLVVDVFRPGLLSESEVSDFVAFLVAFESSVVADSAGDKDGGVDFVCSSSLPGVDR